VSNKNKEGKQNKTTEATWSYHDLKGNSKDRRICENAGIHPEEHRAR